MESALIVSSTDKGTGFLTELLGSCIHFNLIIASSGSEARRLLIEGSFEMVVINAPLKDEFGHELALKCAATSSAGVLLIVKTDLADDISAKVEDYGVFVLPKPISRQLFFQSVKLVQASRKRLLGLKSENVLLQQKIEEIRLVDRAKCALIQYLNLTEAQAHRYIEKQAMDMRLPKSSIAENILKTYES